MHKKRPIWILYVLTTAGSIVYLTAGLALDQPALAKYMISRATKNCLPCY